MFDLVYGRKRENKGVEMSSYDYHCKKCGEVFEYFSKKMLTEKERKPKCTNCGNRNKKTLEFVYAPNPVHFKGHGWTNTRYADNVNPEAIKGVKRLDPKPGDEILHKKKKPRRW